MDAKSVILDTSVLIDYFRKKDKSNSVFYRFSNKYHFYISVITAFELKIGIKTKIHLNDYYTIMENIEILSIDESCIDIAVQIYKNLKRHNNLIELADLLIAATAISNSLPLLTLNIKHFKYIKDLSLV